MYQIEFPLDCDLAIDDQMNTFTPATSTCRKILLAMDIAESSITILDARYGTNKSIFVWIRKWFVILVYNLVDHRKPIVINDEVRLFLRFDLFVTFRFIAGRVAHGKYYRLMKLNLFHRIKSSRSCRSLSQKIEYRWIKSDFSSRSRTTEYQWYWNNHFVIVIDF